MGPASIGALALTWDSPDSNDKNGKPTDDLIPIILVNKYKYT